MSFSKSPCMAKFAPHPQQRGPALLRRHPLLPTKPRRQNDVPLGLVSDAFRNLFEFTVSLKHLQLAPGAHGDHGIEVSKGVPRPHGTATRMMERMLSPISPTL